MFLAIILLIAAFAVSVNAHCDNACSGHGTCATDDICECYDNWGVGLGLLSGDCSDRICPYEIAWVDTPGSSGVFHSYAECAGRGICNRETGECGCFDGYTGKACQRTTCPNDCSGHGTCEYIEDLYFQQVYADYSSLGFSVDPKKFEYYDWDSRKTRGCVCDATYGDVDCSKRLFERGTDPLDVRADLTTSLKYQKQKIDFTFDEAISATYCMGKTFALTYTSKTNETFTTIPIVMKCIANDMTDFQNDIVAALTGLPNGVIGGVSVVAVIPAATTMEVDITVTFSGCNVQGKQNLLTVVAYECSDGCMPKLTGIPINTKTFHASSNITLDQMADYNSYECSRRGKCDYSSGECTCFEGYGGSACNVQTMLV